MDGNASEPRVLARSEHPISRKRLDANAIKVLYRLHNHGFKAYLVGGSVRDGMLGRRPKDYDIGTDARPGQVRRLFRNSRTIGRRFRIVHIYFREGIIEVSTFRRDPDPEAQASAPGELLITDDNVFGSPREDAFRRDFTVNALFYDIADFSVVDYVGGIPDLDKRVIRTIGDPDVRFREDPVRMLRACELAGRLGFAIEGRSQEAIHRQRLEIDKAAPARLTEEIVQCLGCGAAGGALQWMLDLGLLEVFLPEAYAMVTADERGLGEFGKVLPVVDRLVGEGKKLSDGTLIAALLLPSVLLRRHDVEGVNQRPLGRGALQELTMEMVTPFFERFTLARRKADQVLKAILGYFRLGDSRQRPAQMVQLASRPWFDDALALFEIMVEATGEGAEAAERWRRVRKHRPEPKRVAEERPRRRRPRRRRRRR